MGELERRGDPVKAKMVARYMKTSSHRFLGVTVTEVRKITERHIHNLDADAILPLMKLLWLHKVFDFRIAAIQSMEHFSSEGDIDTALELISQWIDDATDIVTYQGDFPVTRVSNHPKQWIDAIRHAIADRDKLAVQGDALRTHIQNHWMLEDNLDKWLAAWLP